MASPAPLPDPTRCPLCGRANQCAMEVAKSTGQPALPCWCASASFSPALLGRIAPEARGLACICAACAAPIGTVAGLPVATQ